MPWLVMPMPHAAQLRHHRVSHPTGHNRTEQQAPARRRRPSPLRRCAPVRRAVEPATGCPAPGARAVAARAPATPSTAWPRAPPAHSHVVHCLLLWRWQTAAPLLTSACVAAGSIYNDGRRCSLFERLGRHSALERLALRGLLHAQRVLLQLVSLLLRQRLDRLELALQRELTYVTHISARTHALVERWRRSK